MSGWKISEEGWGLEYSGTRIHWLHICPIFQWIEWLRWKRYNWINLHIAHVSLEWDRSMMGWEFDFVLLGVGIHVRYTGDWDRDDAPETAKRVQATYDRLHGSECEPWCSREMVETLEGHSCPCGSMRTMTLHLGGEEEP